MFVVHHYLHLIHDPFWVRIWQTRSNHTEGFTFDLYAVDVAIDMNDSDSLKNPNQRLLYFKNRKIRYINQCSDGLTKLWFQHKDQIHIDTFFMFSFKLLWKCLESHCSLFIAILSKRIQNYSVSFAWLYCSVEFHMFPKFSYFNGCIVTLVAFVYFLTTVSFQMCPQSTCRWWCIVALVAFVWFFSTVYFQMFHQGACIRWCKVTLVTFVWVFSTVCFQMCP